MPRGVGQAVGHVDLEGVVGGQPGGEDGHEDNGQQDPPTMPSLRFCFCRSVMAPPLDADFRVDQNIEQVDGQGDEHEGGAGDQHVALDHRVVPVLDGGDHIAAQAGNGEDILDDGAAP